MNTDWEKSILSLGEKKIVEKNTVLYRLGEIGNGFYYIKEGVVKITVYTEDGDEKCFDFRGPGQFVGDYAIIREPFITTGITTEDCILYYFSMENVREIMKSSDDFLDSLLHFIYKKLWIRVKQNLLLSNTEKQMAYAIIKLNELSKNNVIQITQQDLANYIGVTRITVNKFLNRLKEAEIIEVNSKSIEIKNLDYLLDLANEGEE